MRPPISGHDDEILFPFFDIAWWISLSISGLGGVKRGLTLFPTYSHVRDPQSRTIDCDSSKLFLGYRFVGVGVGVVRPYATPLLKP